MHCCCFASSSGSDWWFTKGWVERQCLAGKPSCQIEDFCTQIDTSLLAVYLQSWLHFWGETFISPPSRVRDFHLVVPPRRETQHAPALATSHWLLFLTSLFTSGTTQVSISPSFLPPRWGFQPRCVSLGSLNVPHTLWTLHVIFLIVEPTLAYSLVGEPLPTIWTSVQKSLLVGPPPWSPFSAKSWLDPRHSTGLFPPPPLGFWLSL